MAILRDFEKRLEGAVEGFFARAFRSGLQPVELAKALQRYAANYQQVGLDGVIVPNVYRFELSTSDMERFSGFADSLRRGLGDVVRDTSAERNWRLQGPVRVELRPAEHVRVGTYELRGKVEAAPAPAAVAAAPAAPAAAPPAAPTAAAASATASVPAPAVRVIDQRGEATTVMPTAARASLRIMSGSASGLRHPIEGTTVVGRLPECDVTLDEPSVSRRHARLEPGGDNWTIVDLGSTNGVRVNGEQVARATLRDGDRLELGGVTLAFALE